MKNYNRAFCFTIFASVLSLSIATPANAALVSRLSGQAYYDTDLNITWLANTNLAASNTFGVSGIDSFGQMDWYTAQNWFGAMNAANYLGYSDWRLPMLQPVNGVSFSLGDPQDLSFFDGSADHGFNVTAPSTPYASSTASEMAHLFYNTLGNLGLFDTAGNPEPEGWALQQNSGPFSNLYFLPRYWFGTESPWMIDGAWFFQFDVGFQGSVYKFDPNFTAWAVRTGDVAPVPAPAAFWLFGSGMTVLFAFMRRRLSRDQK